MLANYRCNEIKNCVIQEYQQELQNLTEQSSNKLMTTFQTVCKDLIDKMLGK